MECRGQQEDKEIWVKKNGGAIIKRLKRRHPNIDVVIKGFY